jgi:hypothetical protein
MRDNVDDGPWETWAIFFENKETSMSYESSHGHHYDVGEQARQDAICAASLNFMLFVLENRGRNRFTSADATTWRTIYTMAAQVGEANVAEKMETSVHAPAQSEQTPVQKEVTRTLDRMKTRFTTVSSTSSDNAA